jgi:hypothetical protein
MTVGCRTFGNIDRAWYGPEVAQGLAGRADAEWRKQVVEEAVQMVRKKDYQEVRRDALYEFLRAPNRLIPLGFNVAGCSVVMH